MIACNKNENNQPRLSNEQSDLIENDYLLDTVFLFTATSWEDPDMLSTFSLNLKGEIKTLSTNPLWLGNPILMSGEILLNPFQKQDSSFGAQIIVSPLPTNRMEVVNLQVNPHSLFPSPTSALIAYFISESSQTKLYFYDLESRKEKQIILFAGNNFQIFGWSNDGSKLYYLWQNDVTTNYDLFFVNVDDYSLSQVTNNSNLEILFIESPKDPLSLIGEIEKKDKNSFLDVQHLFAEKYYLMNHSNGIKLKQFERILRSASWSPDGSQIALSLDGNLCFYDVRQSQEDCFLERLLPPEMYESAILYPASWSLDSRFVAFQAINQTTYCHELYIYELASQNLIKPQIQPCFGIELIATSP